MIINRWKDEIITLEGNESCIKNITVYNNGIWFEQQSDHRSNILFYLII